MTQTWEVETGRQRPVRRSAGPTLAGPSLGRLLAAEVSRLLSRRFTLIAVLAVLAVVGLFQLSVNSSLRPPTAAEQAASQATYEEARKYWQENERACAEDGAPPDCSYPEPQLREFSLKPSFGEVARESVQVAVYLVGLTALMIGGSFIGAEYSSGAIGNWLSFIPRRGRVFASKLLTVAGFGALLSALASGLALAVAVVLASAYGVPTGGLADELGMLGRGTLVAVALAVVGFCIGMLGRHTAAALGVLLGYLFVWFVRNAILAESVWAQRLTPWTPEATLSAIVNPGHQYEVRERVVGPEEVSIEAVERWVSLPHGLTYWAVLLTVLVVLTAVVFRRRDVS